MTIQISCFSEITGDWEAGQMVQAAGLGEMRSNGEQKKIGAQNGNGTQRLSGCSQGHKMGGQ